MTPMLIAVDVDGTLYDGGIVATEAIEALRKVDADGHTVIIVTGRRWEDLPNVVPQEVLDLCHALVCEEGGVLVWPETREITLLAETYHPEMVAALAAGGVPTLDVGHVVLAGPSRYIDVFERVHAHFASGHQVIVNKGSVALAPAECDKGTGLRAAIKALRLEGLPIVAIGDATNDIPMFEMADHPYAVANADDTVIAAGFPLLQNRGGHGVAEALQMLLPRDPTCVSDQGL
jgi:hydroxymethylpyrimidine pyrophosphatase-like HAD family hydrolase